MDGGLERGALRRQSGDSTGNIGTDSMEITIAGLAKVLGAIGGLVTTLVVVQPWTVYYIGALKAVFVVLMMGFAVFFAVLLLDRKLRMLHLTTLFSRTATQTLWILICALSASSLLLGVWSQPTRQQVAQQILNDRGMFLQRLYYKTALEVGNANGVELFHEAGFGPELAFELLGQTAETVPDRRSVDVLLNLDDDTLRELLYVMVREGPSAEGYRLIDNAIRYQGANSGREMPGLTDEQVARDSVVALMEDSDDLRFSAGLSLLGHAVLQRNGRAVRLLLSLGADARVATLPLLRADELPAEFRELAVDPFLFLAAVEQTDGDLDVRGFVPSAFVESDAELGERDRSPSCAAVSDGVVPKRFVGYRQLGEDDYAVGELVVDRAIGCTRYATHWEGTLRFGRATDSNRAVLTWPTEIGHRQARDLVGLTSDGAGGVEHFVGDVSEAGNGFVASSAGNGGERMVFVESDRTVDQIAGTLGRQPDLPAVDCVDQRSFLLDGRPRALNCSRWSAAEWRASQRGAHIVAVEEGTEGVRRFALSTEGTVVLLAPREQLVWAIPLADEGGPLELSVAEAPPRIGREVEEWRADWPTVPRVIEGYIGAYEEQSVYVELRERASVFLRLTGLEADIDVQVKLLGDSEVSEQSTNGGAGEEVITGLLPTGQYEIRLVAFDSGSTYTLELGRRELARWQLGEEDRLVEAKGRVAGGEREFRQLEIEGAAYVEVSVTELDADVDLFVNDERNSRLEGTYQSTVAESGDEMVEGWLLPGRYTIELAALEGGSTYTLSAERKRGAVRLGRSDGEWVDVYRFIMDEERDWLYEFDVGEAREVMVTVTPNVGDVDVELLDGGHTVVGSSSNAAGQPDSVRRALGVGTWYVRVFGFGDDPAWAYGIMVEQTGP